MNKYQDWAKHAYSMRQRSIALGFAGIFFLLILPFLLIKSSDLIDEWLQIPRFYAGTVNIIFGLLIGLGGLFLAWWSIYVQMTIGSGTPLPMMPTQRLIVMPPFTYCRNPMTLGTFLGLAGISVWIGSFSALGISFLLTACLLSYLKFIEEKELAIRFGEDYLEYKRNTPFLLPRLRRRS